MSFLGKGEGEGLIFFTSGREGGGELKRERRLDFFHANLKHAFSPGLGSRLIFQRLRLQTFFQAAPALDFFPKRLRLLVFFSREAPGSAPRGKKPAPAPDYWLSLTKYSFPRKLVR